MKTPYKPQINQSPLIVRLLLMIVLAILTFIMASAILSLPENAPGLSEKVFNNIDISGVTNPVTAVLLNYRAYDTLLELGVLLLALLGVWSLGGATQKKELKINPVLSQLSRTLVPILVIVAGYLLWIGAYAPGGAFQAGAVLGAAGVLLFLSGWKLSPNFSGFSLRLSLVAGLIIFSVIGLIFTFMSRNFLEYPIEQAGFLILLVEAAATFSIGISLAALFLGHDPEEENQ